jgi:hypothetical protein
MDHMGDIEVFVIVLMKDDIFWVETPKVWQFTATVLEEPAAFVFRIEDGGNRFL